MKKFAITARFFSLCIVLMLLALPQCIKAETSDLPKVTAESSSVWYSKMVVELELLKGASSKTFIAFIDQGDEKSVIENSLKARAGFRDPALDIFQDQLLRKQLRHHHNNQLLCKTGKDAGTNRGIVEIKTHELETI